MKQPDLPSPDGSGERPIKVLLYGDVNMNIIDGSSVWLQSLARTLQLGRRNETSVLLKAREERDVLTGELRHLDRVEVISPSQLGYHDEQMPIPRALDAICKLDRRRKFDLILLRGYPLTKQAALRAQLHGRLWVYLTDIPQSLDAVTDKDAEHLVQIADASRYLLCQTEELRAHLERLLPDAAPKMILLPPMIPPVEPPPSRARAHRLVYAGKFAPRWGFLEMVEAFAALRERFGDTEFHVVGDKIHGREDPAYKPAVERALAETPGLVWHGAAPRAQVLDIIAGCDVALSYRHPSMNESLELSTKILEYGAAGVPVLLNRTPMHEDLLGSGYPLFVGGADEILPVLSAAFADDALYERARASCLRASESFTFEEAYALLEPFLERVVPRSDRRIPGAGERSSLLIAGHDMKFFTAIRHHFETFEHLAVQEDLWTSHTHHDVEKSKNLLDRADAIVCEWCVGNAVWYSENKRPGQRLIVRFHRFELETPYPEEIVIDNVDTMVFVGPHYQRQACERFGWPEDRCRVIPNWVDVVSLDRPKLSGAMFTLGMLGFVPKRKRLDRALDILEQLRAEDPRFRLAVKGQMPWQYRWVWVRDHEWEYFEHVFERIQRSPLLGDAVSFEPFGADVGSWLRTIGWMLSTSEDESFHLAPAEAMASRAVPVVLPWEGAGDMYPGKWIHPSAEAAARAMLRTVAEGSWHQQGEEGQRLIRERYAVERVMPMWDELVLAPLPQPVA